VEIGTSAAGHRPQGLHGRVRVPSLRVKSGVAFPAGSCDDGAVNQESLDRANAFLAAVAAKVSPGEVLHATPAEIGREMGLNEPLAAARAVRALLARRRLEVADGSYRLLDARPIEAGEREQIPRTRRRKRVREAAGRQPPADGGRPTYSAVGREAIERLIELGREVATLRASLRAARDEAREAREARDESERRAQSLAARVRDLESRAEMAEANLRTLLAAAKSAGKEQAVGDTEMEAILGVLKGAAPDGDERG
jgi:hypothetical protein